MLDGIKRLLGVESRSFTTLSVSDVAARASGAALGGTGIAEACASLWARGLASASVEGTEALTPAVLEMAGRHLYLRGEIVFAIRTSGGLTLQPASAWDIAGAGPDESRWLYQLQLNGPTESTTLPIRGAGVLHVRYGSHLEAPWQGNSPLALAGITPQILHRVEEVWCREAHGVHGYLLPLPKAGKDDTTLDEIRAAIKQGKGNIATVETTQTGYGVGRESAPQAEYVAKRYGGNPPPELREIRKEIVPAILAASGVPIELIRSSDGSGMRESWRRFVLSTIQPLGNLVAAEASRKLERPVSLSFESLRGSDSQGLSRAIKALVDSGMSLPDALETVGL